MWALPVIGIVISFFAAIIKRAKPPNINDQIDELERLGAIRPRFDRDVWGVKQMTFSREYIESGDSVRAAKAATATKPAPPKRSPFRFGLSRKLELDSNDSGPPPYGGSPEHIEPRLR